MKKTYKTFNGENRNCFFKVGKALVEARFAPTYTTDNEFVQKAIEDSFSFKVGELQLVTLPMQWITIDRDENGIATEECLDNMRKALPFVFVTTHTKKDVYVSVSDEQEFEMYECELRTNLYDSNYYLPIPKAPEE